MWIIVALASLNASNCFSLPLDHWINKSHKKQINSAATDKWLSEFSYLTETWYSFRENGPINHRGWRTSAISVQSRRLLSTVLIEAAKEDSFNKSLFSFWRLLKKDSSLYLSGVTEHLLNRNSHKLKIMD